LLSALLRSWNPFRFLRRRIDPDPLLSLLPAKLSAIPVSTPAARLQPPECQRHRRADYHRKKIQTDPVYAQVVQDSRKQWREEHADYQKSYWRTHPEAAARNRERQRQLDRQRRVISLVKNNLALDLKRSDAEVWLVGPDAANLVKNNVAFPEVMVFQRVIPSSPESCKEQRPGSNGDLPL
jgi:hypothetical protein